MLPLFKVFISPSAGSEIQKTLDSGYIGQGKKVEEFEKALSDFFNNPWILTTNSCTSALHLSGLFSERGEALCPPLTCLATSAALTHAGHNIKWVDIERNGNINLLDLEAKLTQNTRVVMVVHFAGSPVDLDKLHSILSRHAEINGTYPLVIEDCAHAIGSRYNNKPVGSSGNICCFSFQAVKTITTADGGCLVLQNKEQFERARRLRWYGLSREVTIFEQDVEEIGFKYNMNDLNATLGLCNFQHLKELLIQQKDNFEYYQKKLPEISLSYCGEPNGWMYPVWVDNKVDFEKRMSERGIQTSQAHCRNDIYSCHTSGNLPIMAIAEKHLTCIPSGWWIKDEEREYIVDSIKRG